MKSHRAAKNDNLKSLCGLKGVETDTSGITCGRCGRIYEINEDKALAIWKEAMALSDLIKAERRGDRVVASAEEAGNALR